MESSASAAYQLGSARNPDSCVQVCTLPAPIWPHVGAWGFTRRLVRPRQPPVSAQLFRNLALASARKVKAIGYWLDRATGPF